MSCRKLETSRLTTSGHRGVSELMPRGGGGAANPRALHGRHGTGAADRRVSPLRQTPKSLGNSNGIFQRPGAWQCDQQAAGRLTRRSCPAPGDGQQTLLLRARGVVSMLAMRQRTYALLTCRSARQVWLSSMQTTTSRPIVSWHRIRQNVPPLNAHDGDGAHFTFAGFGQ